MPEEQPDAGVFEHKDTIGLTAKPIIKILIYTDNPGTTADLTQLSLGRMIAHIKAHVPAFAKVSIEFRCRNFEGEANKLETGVVNQFAEIWFFGFNQANRQSLLKVGQESELDKDEVAALEEWMGPQGNAGGVLMTGDHSDPRLADAVLGQNERCPDNAELATLLGLGRAIGRCVPRAGRLRKWEGPPTLHLEDSHNTLVVEPDFHVDDGSFQKDPTPQQLVLRRFDQTGQQAADGLPHPLFFYQGNQWIRFFPDHGHEGELVLPCDDDLKDKGVWPEGSKAQPRPQVVAFGVDESHCELVKLVAAYNGDRAGVGRIVADSTWHHYLNINLTNLDSPSLRGSAADQIGQFYSNLVIWLSPLSVRQAMAQAMVQWLARHPTISEERNNEPLAIGRLAYPILREVASPCEIHELLQIGVPDQYRERFEMLYLPDSGYTLSALPSKELTLGSILKRYYEEMNKIKTLVPETALEFAEMKTAAEATVNESGVRQAFSAQADQIAAIALEIKKITDGE